ncbi:hypothetical protein VNO77_15838 [Canavalia gladiata]|uniref:Late embryogenesis abundant protein LEA-2 subgroup domain-containing protein n=1 Tax=Canavalia gladiata TaxID=3824 RepID=A0AAN9QRF5_CANGL
MDLARRVGEFKLECKDRDFDFWLQHSRVLAKLLVIVTIAGFTFWFIVRPKEVNFHVTNATLTQFNYSNDTLYYDLALNVEVRNPNKKISMYYNYIEALALYQDVIPLNKDQISEMYNNEKRYGIYHIDVKLNLKVKFNLGWYKTKNLKFKVACNLQVPLQSYNGTSPAAGFHATRCNWDYKHILIFVLAEWKCVKSNVVYAIEENNTNNVGSEFLKMTDENVIPTQCSVKVLILVKEHAVDVGNERCC